MAFSALDERAKMRDASTSMDVNRLMDQGSFSKTSNPLHDPLSEMGQGKLGHFQGGDLGTFMDQAPSGGKV